MMEMDVLLTLCSCLGLETPQPERESLRHVLGARWGFPAFQGCSSIPAELRLWGQARNEKLLLQPGKQVWAELKKGG